jgi:tetratricopeptide (TPR) repeat protein
MDPINRQIAKASRLLWTQTLLNILSWMLIASFSICFAVLLVPKLWFVPYQLNAVWWMVGSGVFAVAISVIVGLFFQPSVLHSAIELDRRFGLRERVSSALQLDPEQRVTPVGNALIQDATDKIERIDVRDQFPVKTSPQTPWVLLPLLACIALLWVPDAELPAIGKLAGSANDRLTNVKNQTKPILAQIQKKRQEAEEKGLQEAVDQFKKLEKKIEDIQKSNTLDSKKVLSDFNEIKKEMEQRKESLGGTDSVKKALSNLSKMDKGPAEKMANAIKDGDFDKAGTELEKLLDKMKTGNLSEDQKKQLAKQLDQIQKALGDALEKQQQAIEETKKEIARAKNAGDIETAAKLQKKLEQQEANAKKATAMEAVKDKLEKAKQAMEKGDDPGAQKALEELQGELGEMAEDQEALEEMEAMLAELQDAKNSSNCAECNGGGCGKCQSDKLGKPTKNSKGEGKGQGEREEEETNTKNIDSQVREQPRKGETVLGPKVGGPNRKGTTKEEVRDAILSSTPDDPDAIENMMLPKAQRDQQRDYFNSLRDK